MVRFMNESLSAVDATLGFMCVKVDVNSRMAQSSSATVARDDSLAGLNWRHLLDEVDGPLLVDLLGTVHISGHSNVFRIPGLARMNLGVFGIRWLKRD